VETGDVFHATVPPLEVVCVITRSLGQQWIWPKRGLRTGSPCPMSPAPPLRLLEFLSEYIFFLPAHGMFSRVSPILGYNISLNKIKKWKSYHVFSVHKGVNLEINKKIFRNCMNTWKLSDVFMTSNDTMMQLKEIF
jgi:hypothetical protein